MSENGRLHIACIEIENVKKLKAVHLEPVGQGLTIVGGKNGQGKTSVLDSIAWALGGGKRKPSNAKREGSTKSPEISITLSNGLRVERKGKNSTLTVIDETGMRGGQTLLDAFVSEFALDLPKFINASATEKAKLLLRNLGIGDELATLESAEKRLYDERRALGQIADPKKKHADELPEYPDAPDSPVSVSDLVGQHKAILARNSENEEGRRSAAACADNLALADGIVQRLADQLATAREEQEQVANMYAEALKLTEGLKDESTAEVEAQIASAESVNEKVAANRQKAAAIKEATELSTQYDAKTTAIDDVRAKRLALLDGAALPLPNLTIEEGELVYQGQRWDCMSNAEQLRVSVAVIRGLNPDCGFVLMDKLEQMDMDTLREFGTWLESEGLQVIATRVSTGDECSIVIEDGAPLVKTAGAATEKVA